LPKSIRQPTRTTSGRKSVSSTRRSKPTQQTARSRKSTGGSRPARRPPVNPLSGWNRLSIDHKLDILGVVLALAGLLTLLSLLSSSHGAITGWWVNFVNQIAGWGSFILPIALTGVGVWLVLRNVESLPMLSVERMAGVILLYMNMLAWLHLFGGGGWDLAAQGLGGGYIGALFEVVLVGALGIAGTVVVLSSWLLIAVALSLDISITQLFGFFQRLLASLARRVKAQTAPQPTQSHNVPALNHPLRNLSQPDDLPEAGSGTALPTGFKPMRTSRAPAEGETVSPSPADPNAPARLRRPSASESPAARGPSEVKVTHNTPSAPPWKLPVIADILDPGAPETVKSNQDNERGKVIEDTLQSFGTPVKVVEIHRGPTVTQFGVEPLYVENRTGRTRVRVSKIVALADDLALALAAPRIRIQAPVPGRNYVGIEVPNLEISRVPLRDVMESEPFKRLKSPLRFALGKDVSGHGKVYDLASMPHLLIAGTTGSGKSVCVNSLLSCLLLNNTPTELRMILVDPKRVELTGYNGIPHLLAPVVVEAEQVVGALQWVQREMDARYHLFSRVGARNIVEYNNKNSPPLPYMLVLVDELADLMMLAPDETERSLTRLAQLARATGIHLVLATQRPSVDVVTGLIKANFPARIAFAVASGTDSRVILDQPGAERLLGRGDMLFQAPDAAAPVRVQGVWVSDVEIQRLVEYWRNQAYELRNQVITSPTAVPVNMDLPLNAPLRQTPLWGEDGDKPGDPLMPEATNIVRQEGKASISMLQRKMRIGYTRAARLIDALEEQGIIGPAQATSQVREVLDLGNEMNSETDNTLPE